MYIHISTYIQNIRVRIYIYIHAYIRILYCNTITYPPYCDFFLLCIFHPAFFFFFFFVHARERTRGVIDAGKCLSGFHNGFAFKFFSKKKKKKNVTKRGHTCEKMLLEIIFPHIFFPFSINLTIRSRIFT